MILLVKFELVQSMNSFFPRLKDLEEKNYTSWKFQNKLKQIPYLLDTICTTYLLLVFLQSDFKYIQSIVFRFVENDKLNPDLSRNFVLIEFFPLL